MRNAIMKSKSSGFKNGGSRMFAVHTGLQKKGEKMNAGGTQFKIQLNINNASFNA